MRPQLKPLSEQVVVITGATSGIGLETARRASAAGAAVVLAARNEEALKSVVDELRDRGGEAEYVVADVGEEEEIDRIAEVAKQRFGGFDTWINDAGVATYSTYNEITREDHEKIFKTNYWGVVNGSKAAMDFFRESGRHGALINLGSVLADVATTPLSAYSASKHAVKGFTDGLRMEVLQEDLPVSITLIKPSGIDTPFTEHAKNYMKYRARVPPVVYAPKVVAKTILHAAAHPVREVTIGGGGRMIALLASIAPQFAERFYAKVLPALQRDKSRPPVESTNLHHPGRDLRTRGDHQFVRNSSLLTTMQLHPILSVAAFGVLAAAAAGWLASHFQRRPRPLPLRKGFVRLNPL